MGFLLLLFLLFVIVPIWMTFRARRRAQDVAEQMQQEQMQGYGPAGGAPPSLFDLFMGPGMWSRSYEIDPQTGEWVDVTDRRPQQPADPKPDPAPEEKRQERVRRARPRPAANPLGGLFGGMGQMGGMGGAGGDFDVQPPDELVDFDDVGGMDGLQRARHQSARLLAEHPDRGGGYGVQGNGL